MAAHIAFGKNIPAQYFHNVQRRKEHQRIEMKKLDLLLLKSAIGPFILTFFIALFVLIMQFLWKYIDDLVGKGLEYSVIAELIFYASAGVIPLALPIAVLLTAIMTFGSLGEHYELVAFKSAGISLFRIMRSLLLSAIGLTIGAFLFANYILPAANLKFATLLWSVHKQRPALNIKPGVFYNGIEGYVLRVSEKEEGSKTIKDILIYDHKDARGNTRVIMAEKGEMYSTPDERFLVFRLFNGTQYEEPQPSPQKRFDHEFMRTEFAEYEMYMDLSNFDFNKADEGMFKTNQRMLRFDRLVHIADSLKAEDIANATPTTVQGRLNFMNALNSLPNDPVFTPIAGDSIAQSPPVADTMRNLLAVLPQNFSAADKLKLIQQGKNLVQGTKFNLLSAQGENTGNKKRIMRYMVEAHGRLVYSVACLLLFLVGAPLGAIIRRGGLGLPLVVAIIFFIIFHVLTTIGKKFAEEYALSPFAGMWLSTAVILPIGAFLTYKAMRDSALLNLDIYIARLKAIGSNLGRKKKTG